MAAGFEGITVEAGGIQLIPPFFGFQGVTVEEITSQYFAPQFGFQGITMEFAEPVNESVIIKITKK